MNFSMILLQAMRPMYHEYHAEYFIKQPWNAASSLIFFIPVIYWIWKLKPNFRQYPVLTSILPLLFLNGLGSTLFHAFKPNMFFALLDGIPPMVMVILLSSYFWTKITHSWIKGVAIVLGCYGLNIFMVYILYVRYQMAGAANLAYLGTGLTLLAPITMVLIRTNWQQWKLIATALFFISMALLFRVLDYPNPNPLPETLPQGTHFLWHVFSAIAVIPLGYFLIHVQDLHKEPQKAYA